MDQTWFYSILIFLGVLYLIIGLWASKGIKDNHDYFLAGRNLGIIPLVLTLLATQIGGGALLGTANESYQSGISGIFYNLGMCFGFLLLGFSFAGKWRRFEVATVPEIFETHYKSLPLRMVASILSMLSLFGLLVGQVVASKSLLVGLGLYSAPILTLLWLFIIIYTVTGGLKAVVYTDVVQILLIIIVFAVAFFISGHHSLTNGLPFPPFFDYFHGVDIESGPIFETGKKISLWSLFFFPMMFSLIEQDLAQRFFAAKNEKDAKWSAIITAIVVLIFSIIPVHFGMKARLIGPIPEQEGGSVLIMMLKMILSPSFLALAICSLLAAIISTADSLLCAVSSHLCLDFSLEKKIPMDSKNISRIVTLIIGILAIVLGFYFDNILEILIRSYELPVTILFASIFISFYKKKLNPLSAKLSVASGFICYLAMFFLPPMILSLPKEIFSIGVTFLFYFLGELISHKAEKKL